MVVGRAVEDDVRYWILDGYTGQGEAIPTDELSLQPACLAWTTAGVYLSVGGWYRFDGALHLIAPVGDQHLPPSWDLDSRSIPTGEVAVISKFDASRIPGSDPPPGEASLGLLTPAGSIPLTDAGTIGRLSAGVGPTVIARTTTYTSRRENGGWDTTSRWVMFRGEQKIDPSTLHDGTPILAPTGDRIAWSLVDRTAITDLDGTELSAVEQSFEDGAWAREGGAFAGVRDGTLWTADLDSGEVTERAMSQIEQIAWAPTGDRLLVETRCEDQDVPFRLTVISAGATELETACAPRRFAAWSADGMTMALNDFGDGSRFLLLELDGTEGALFDGRVCAFRPPS